MKTIDSHSLLKGTPKIIKNSAIAELFQIWNNLMKEKTGSGSNDFNAFLAGYFFGNKCDFA